MSKKPITLPPRSLEEFLQDAHDLITWADETESRALQAVGSARRAAEQAEGYQAIERMGTTGLMFWSWQCLRELDAMAERYPRALEYYRDDIARMLG
ncbi:MAG: hypothetical protein KGR26_15315, partial [Cyanobacteria bacterium REEB65]|nr:hypothetical protein [Cyanobacteria bacterium REEB65]